MRWFLLFILLTSPVLAQSVLPGNGALAKQNVTLVYNTITGQADMVIVDANNLNDPAWNPPNTRQINIPLAAYNSIADPVAFQGYMASAISNDIAAQAANAAVP